MPTIYWLTALFALTFIIIYTSELNWKRLLSNHYVILISSAVLIRLIAMRFEVMYVNDITTFKAWAVMLYDKGLSGFYTSGYFTDYPPGYMYVLYIIGMLRSFFKLTHESAVFTALIKLPAIIFDITTVIFVYKTALTKLGKNSALIIALFFAANPAIILNSAVWGQVDSIYTLLVVSSVYYLTRKDYTPSLMIFTAAVLIKPQALIFTPLYIYAAYSLLKESRYSKDSFALIGKYLFMCLFMLIALMIPFTKGLDFKPIINQYMSTIKSYPYATLNAYNFYAFVGANWVPADNPFLIATYSQMGIIFILLSVGLVCFLLYKRAEVSDYFYAGALLNTLTFMFSIKMHERYIYPTILLLLMSYVFNRDRRLTLLITGFSMTMFVNCADVLNMITKGNDLYLLQNTLPLLSTINLILTAYMIYVAFDSRKPVRLPVKETSDVQALQFTEKSPRLKTSELIFITLLIIIYSFTAFFNLGDNKSAETMWHGFAGESIKVDLGKETELSKIIFRTGGKENRTLLVCASNDGVTFGAPIEIPTKNVFVWNYITFDVTARFLELTVRDGDLYLAELAFRNKSGRLTPVKYAEKDALLFDEQDLVPEAYSYKNSTYFDEIYHARTAYEFINQQPIYEWTHPPLGKNLIALGIKIFGMNPFGWRFMGTFFGVLMIPAMYLFARVLFKNPIWSGFAIIIFTFDFMHFAQTRIATIDTYVTIFIMLMYLSMFVYYNMSFYTTSLFKTLIPLGLAGIFTGLAASSKWQGIYAAAGLAVIFFYTLYQRYKETLSTPEENRRELTSAFYKNTAITIGFCLVFFIAVPLTIYALSYIPYLKASGVSGLKAGIKAIIKNQQDILKYHSTLVSEHPYASPWWTWPFNIRPIFFYANTIKDGIRQGISSFGNPAVWWAGVPALFYTLRQVIKEKDKTALFLIIAYLAQLLPWVPVPRTTYIYHYFPCLPFMVLMIARMFRDIVRQTGKRGFLTAAVYLTAVVVLFITFYPVLTGLGINIDYVNTFLKWLPTWQLI